MSLPNSFFSATRQEAVAYAFDDSGEIAEIFEFGGITDLDLSNLFAIVVEEEFDCDLHESLPLEEETQVELIEIPSRLLSARAEKTDSELPKIALQWSKTEELSCDPKDLDHILEALIAFSNSKGDKNVYFTQ